jgi:hypothetical protein
MNIAPPCDAYLTGAEFNPAGVLARLHGTGTNASLEQVVQLRSAEFTVIP